MPQVPMSAMDGRACGAQGRREIQWRGGRWFAFGFAACGLTAMITTARPASAAPQVFSGTGTAGATAALNDFRAAIGSVNNGATPVPQNGGRREINWDAVKLDGTDFGGKSQVIVPDWTVGIPVERFQARGAFFDQVYAVSGDGFATANPGAAGQFPAFSPTKTFAMFNQSSINMSFVVASDPGTTPTPVPAGVRGFGVIFLDVETPNTSAVEFFSGTKSLGKLFAPAGRSGDPEFVGALFDAAVVTNVVITPGTATLFSFDGTKVTAGPADLSNGGTQDLVATDDFVYSEPVALNPSGRLLAAPKQVQFASSQRPTLQVKVLRINNTGRTDLAGVVGGLEAPFRVVSGGGFFSIAPGRSHLVRIEFAPESKESVESSLQINSTDPQHPFISVPITGGKKH